MNDCLSRGRPFPTLLLTQSFSVCFKCHFGCQPPGVFVETGWKRIYLVCGLKKCRWRCDFGCLQPGVFISVGCKRVCLHVRCWKSAGLDAILLAYLEAYLFASVANASTWSLYWRSWHRCGSNLVR